MEEPGRTSTVATTLDLDAYLARIGYAGSRAPTLETLQAIHRAHAQTIPFENLDPWLGLPVRLDLDALQQKLVSARRGGYCFEQNLLLSHALTALGFEVTSLAARVLWNRSCDAIAPRTHMLLLVDLDDRAYLADVGFGGLTMTGALRLVADLDQVTPHERFHLTRHGDTFTVHARVCGQWTTLYRFDLQEQAAPDYEVGNWYASTHPESPFVTTLMAARPDPDRRVTLRDNELTVHHLHGRTEQRRLTDPCELRGALEGLLGINVPSSPDVDAALARLRPS